MTNRTREIMEFAFLEPLASDDIEHMLRECNEEEVDHLEHGASSLLNSIRSIDATEWRDPEKEGEVLEIPR